MRWRIITWITLVSTGLSHIMIRKRKLYYDFYEYKGMPNKSLGKSFSNYVVQAKIPFKQNLIRHDLKHILLGYKMTMQDELRIHAFLVGNRCYNPIAMAYLFICLLIVPESIGGIKNDFYRGRKTPCLKKTNLQKLAQKDLTKCRIELGVPPLKKGLFYSS